MDLSALIVFATTLAVVSGSPGPSLAALCARVMVRGWREAIPFLAAMWIGELIWLTSALLGMAALAETFHWAFLTIKYLGVVYLAYLAWRMWHAPVAFENRGQPSTRRQRGNIFLAGLSVTLGNPKIMLFYLVLLPSILDLTQVDLGSWIVLGLVTLAVCSLVDLSYVLLATRVRDLMRRPATLRRANRTSALIMGTAAAAIATR